MNPHVHSAQTPSRQALHLVIALLGVITVAALAYMAYRWHAQESTRICQRAAGSVLKEQVWQHLLKMAVDPVHDYNIEIERKLKEIRALRQRLPDAIVDEGLNPGFRMTPPQPQDVRLVFGLAEPKIQARQVKDGHGGSTPSGACEAYFPVQLPNGEVLGATLAWQVIDDQLHRFAFEPSLELDGAIRQFGIDLNLPLYHLTHHMAKVGTGYYFFDPSRRKTAEAEARSYKNQIFRKYGLDPQTVTFSVPMELK